MYLKEVHLPSRDLVAQKRFYDTVLGVPLLESTPACLSYQIGASRLSLHRSDHPGIGHYHFAMNIPPQGYEDALAWITQRTPLVLNEKDSPVVYFENWDAHALYFDDPEGNSLEFIARHSLKTPRQTFQGSADILAISEISQAVPNIADTVQTLKAQTGANVYKNSISDEFAAVGDEEGLVICVRIGREWFMNPGRVAKECPTKIHIEDKNGLRIVGWTGGLFPGMGL